jgi:hypothetical protein
MDGLLVSAGREQPDHFEAQALRGGGYQRFSAGVTGSST